jgi:hypothetical protein
MPVPGIASGRLHSIVVVLSLLMAACSGGSTSPETGAASASAPARGTTAPTPSSTPEPTPLPLPDHDLQGAQTWFSPNMGSVDFPELFSHPDLWATARDAVGVFQFYANSVSGDPYDIGGDNVLETFVEVDAFAHLYEWDIPVAIEAGVIKFFACTHGSWAEYANRAIDNIEANGGRVSFIAMDEPLLGGQLVEGGTTCGYTMEEAAAEVAAFVVAVQAKHPDVRIGTIETSPPQTVQEIDAWMAALEAAGATPAFLHLDVEVADGIANPAFLAELAWLRDATEARGIPFGLILTADWQVATSDATYVESVRQWALAIGDGMGRPTHVVFQSWMGPAASGFHEIPINLPDDDPASFSHTRLIIDGLELLDGAGGS